MLEEGLALQSYFEINSQIGLPPPKARLAPRATRDSKDLRPTPLILRLLKTDHPQCSCVASLQLLPRA